MKKQLQLAATLTLVLLGQISLALVPASRQMAAFSAVMDQVMNGKEGFVYTEDALTPFLADPTAEARRIIEKQEPPVDPEVAAMPEDIIGRWGYPSEKYDVVTEDGYILTVYRIPHSRHLNATPTAPRPVVFLMHGLECSCTNWITNLPNEAAAFMFADAGFDVWLGNFRGNTYSKRHVKLTPKDHEFWKFSWDQMAKYDLPAMINLALNISGAQRLYYVGHSMGSLTAFAHFSQDLVFAKKIIKFYALGPVVTVKYIKGVFRFFAPFVNSLDELFKLVGVDEFLPNNRLMDFLAKYFCGNPISDTVCSDIIFLFGGPDSHQMNVTRLPVYLSHTPAGTSTQNIVHFGQMVQSGKCEMYDWGKKENRKRYNQDTPPEYDVSRMQVPVGIYWGALDWLATPGAVEELIPKLQNIFDNRYYEEFNHLDFIWGLRAAPDVYEPILQDITNDYRTAKLTLN